MTGARINRQSPEPHPAERASGGGSTAGRLAGSPPLAADGTPASPRIVASGEGSLLVRIGGEISLENHRRVRRLTRWILDQAWPFLRNVHPAYATLLVEFDPLAIDLSHVETLLHRALAVLADLPEPPIRTVELPVCYGGAHGPDLSAVAAQCDLSEEEVVRRHAAGDYLVYFLGFSPGFPYLGGLEPLLAAPRLAAPRRSVPAGSVAIGGAQTGVYPVASPGGWRLIGRTPVRLFDAAADPPALLEMGDCVRFVPITATEYELLEKESER